MKKHLLNAFVLVVALISLGQLSSCKDYGEDLRNDLRQTNLTLEEKVGLINNRLDELKAMHEACKADCQKQLNYLLMRVGSLSDSVGTNDAAIKDIYGKIAGLTENGNLSQDQIEIVKQQILQILMGKGLIGPDGSGVGEVPLNQQLATINDELSRIATLIEGAEGLKKRIEDLEAFNANLGTRLQQMSDSIKNIKPGISAEEARTIANNEATAVFDAKIATLNSTVSNLVDVVIPNLQTLANNNKAAIDSALVQLQANYDSISAVDNKYASLYNTLKAKYEGLEKGYTNLMGKYNALSESIGTLRNELDGINSRLTVTEKNAINAWNETVKNKKSITTIEALLGGISVVDLKAALEKTDAQTQLNKSNIENNKKLIDKLVAQMDSMRAEVKSLREDYDKLFTRIGNAENKIGNLEATIATLATQSDLNALAARVATNENEILELNRKYNKLMKIYDRLNSLITSIEVQRVVNPLFGGFSTPLGIETSILVNYWGQYTGAKDLEFPSNRAVDGVDNMLSAGDAQMLAGLYTPEVFTNNQYLVEDCGVGNVYLTINPNNVNFTGGNLTLETSIGRQSGVELRNVRYSNEELTFGGSRSAANGFYMAEAYLPATAEAINRTKIEIVPGLKSAVKEVVTDRSRSSIVNLLSKVYRQVTTGMPAYGIKAAWTADDGNGPKEYAVVSKYNIAATCFRPLSYNALAGTSINRKLPTFGTRHQIAEILNEVFNSNKFHFDLGNPSLHLGQIDFDFQLGNFSLNADGVNIVAHSEGVKVEGTLENGEHFSTTTDPFDVVVTSDNLQPLIDHLNAQLNDQVAQWNVEMQEAFNDAVAQLTNEIQTKITQLYRDMEITLNEQIADILEDVKGDISGRLQAYMDRFNILIQYYNAIANRVNKVLKDPNHYLQVTMLYKGSDGNIHFLSNDPKDPTCAISAGGTGMTVYATSYTAEIAAPAYRKFVAITNITDAQGNSAKGGNATLKAQLTQLNKSGNLCKVMTGRAKRFGIPTQNMKKGYTYEILYTGLDYHGYTSTQHFYLKIK